MKTTPPSANMKHTKKVQQNTRQHFLTAIKQEQNDIKAAQFQIREKAEPHTWDDCYYFCIRTYSASMYPVDMFFPLLDLWQVLVAAANTSSYCTVYLHMTYRVPSPPLCWLKFANVVTWYLLVHRDLHLGGLAAARFNAFASFVVLLPISQPHDRRVFTTFGVTAAVSGTRRKMNDLWMA